MEYLKHPSQKECSLFKRIQNASGGKDLRSVFLFDAITPRATLNLSGNIY